MTAAGVAGAPAAPQVLEFAGFAALEVPPLRGSAAQIAFAERLRAVELHDLRRWWIDADRYGDPGGEPPQVASWRGFARRHMYARAQTRWARWIGGSSDERADRPVAEEIFARAAVVELEQIKRALYARIRTVVARDSAAWWIDRSLRETVFAGVIHLGDLDPLPRPSRGAESV